MKSTLRKIRLWSKEHSLAIVSGLVIALIVASPHIRAWQIVGSENFEGVYAVFSDDELAYQARIKEVIEGDLGLGNPYLKEHSNDPFIMPPVAEWLLAAVVRITHTSVPFVTSAGDFFLTFVNFLLVYLLFLVVTRNNKITALVYTTIFFILSLATFGRPISPQINAIPFFIGLIYIAKLHFQRGENTKRRNLFAGLYTGITVFLYPYFFTTMLAIYGLLITGRAIFEKRFSVVKDNATWFFAAFLPFAALFAFFQMRAAEHAFYSESLARYGLMHTHIPGSFTNVVLGLLTLGVVMLAVKFLKREEMVFAACAALSIVALNWQNVITGKSLQFASHYRPTLVLTVILVLAVVHIAVMHNKSLTTPRFSRILRGGVIAAMCALLIIVTFVRKDEFIHMVDAPYTKKDLIEAQEKKEVFDWFNRYTAADSVVYSLGGEYEELLPVYTHNKVYFNFYAAFYPASHAEIEERWLIQNLFDPTLDESALRSRQREYVSNRFIDSYSSAESRKKIYSMVTRTPYEPGVMVPPEYVRYMHNQLLSLRALPVEDALMRYELDYILLSFGYPYFEETKLKLDEVSAASLVATLDEGLVYHFTPTP